MNTSSSPSSPSPTDSLSASCASGERSVLATSRYYSKVLQSSALTAEEKAHFLEVAKNGEVSDLDALRLEASQPVSLAVQALFEEEKERQQILGEFFHAHKIHLAERAQRLTTSVHESSSSAVRPKRLG